ncbi:ribonuclease P protein subunit p21-like [Camarhynchus parvulus]|uniref:ribonuclease P protein subunit p21-like n=1 Tax=Geospiza parvula TaxID=87175 RepID=UPI001237B71C|nr:ribonuclease P protein subunit p21-like [Camarhynchus parvulus]
MAAPVKDREALQRLNFLFQAAHWSLPLSPGLSRFLLRTQRAAARRLVLRLAPSVKRRLCRRCCSLQAPGAGSQVRLRGRGQPCLLQRCLTCGRLRRFLCPPEPRPPRPRPPQQDTPTGPTPAL